MTKSPESYLVRIDEGQVRTQKPGNEQRTREQLPSSREKRSKKQSNQNSQSRMTKEQRFQCMKLYHYYSSQSSSVEQPVCFADDVDIKILRQDCHSLSRDRLHRFQDLSRHTSREALGSNGKVNLKIEAQKQLHSPAVPGRNLPLPLIQSMGTKDYKLSTSNSEMIEQVEMHIDQNFYTPYDSICSPSPFKYLAKQGKIPVEAKMGRGIVISNKPVQVVPLKSINTHIQEITSRPAFTNRRA